MINFDMILAYLSIIIQRIIKVERRPVTEDWITHIVNLLSLVMIRMVVFSMVNLTKDAAHILLHRLRLMQLGQTQVMAGQLHLTSLLAVQLGMGGSSGPMGGKVLLKQLFGGKVGVANLTSYRGFLCRGVVVW